MQHRPIGLSFSMRLGTTEYAYRLPAKTEPVLKSLLGKRSRTTRLTPALQQQAERTAWRIVLRWVQAQMALIDTGMADVAEVFYPYAVTPSGQTAYEVWREQQRALPPG